MTQRAGLKLGGLVMERRCSRSLAESRRRVALEAKHIDIAELEHVRVGRSVRGVARRASLGFYRRMFKDERAVLVDVALKANRILSSRSAHLLGCCGSMRIMAIAALNESFVHTVMEWHAKLRLLLQMAGIAKLGLCLHQQEFLGFCMMGRVAGDAAHVALSMQRVHRIHVLGATGMARQAAVVDFFGRMILEDEDLRYVAASGDVRRPGTMATFTSLVGWPPFRIKCCFPVRGLLPAVVNVLVAGFASLCSDIIGGTVWASGCLVLARHRMNRTRGLSEPGPRYCTGP